LDASLVGHACMLAGCLGWVGLCLACLLLDKSSRDRLPPG
jgi:hypothetical protein